MLKLAQKMGEKMKARRVFVTCMLVNVVFALLVSVSGATWCDTDFDKRINVSVNNTGGSALTDYQLYVNLSSNPINETSLRVYNATSCTLRAHWCENVTSGNCYALWINYSAVASSGWTNNTALYYDNAAASDVSNGTTTFTFFDNFEEETTINETYLTSWSKSGSNPLQDKTCQNWFISVYSNYSGEDKIYIFEQRDAANNNTIEAWSFTRANASTPANWTDHGVIFTGSGAHDDGHIEPHGIFFETQSMSDAREGVGAGLGTPKWRMYYCAKGSGESAAKYSANFVYASESDLTSWTAYASNPVYDHDATYGYADSKVCIYDNKVWLHHCKYTGAISCDPQFFSVSDNGIDNWTDKTTSWKSENTPIGTLVPFSSGILLTGRNSTYTEYNGYFTTDGDDKAIYSGNPILSGGGSGTWDENMYWVTIVVDKDGDANLNSAGTYYMYYIGHNVTVDKLGLATSTTLTEESETTSILDATKWNSGGSPTISSGKLLINVNNEYIRSINTFQYKAMKARVKYPATPISHYYFGFQSSAGAGSYDTESFFSYDTPDLKTISGVAAGTEATSIYNSAYFGSYHNYEILWKSGEAKFYVDETLKDTDTTEVCTIANPVGFYGYTNPGDMYVDWTFVRAYSTPEPSLVLGSEDGQSESTPAISNVVNGSISATSQYIDWDVNQTAHNRVLYSNESDLTPAYYSTWDNSTAAPNITLTALEASTQYWYQAKSHNITNTSLSDNSSTLSFTTAVENTYIPPEPTTLANTTGNFWVNHTWNNGTGNQTDSYNVSVNTTWYNTTTNKYYNNTGLSAHGWSNMTIYAFNSTSTGVLSNGNVSQDTQVPNNAITISNCSNKNVIETQNVYVDIDSSDTDGDTPTYSCNRTDLFIDFSTSSGKCNWSTDTLDNGTYYIDFGVADGFGSTDNCTVTVEVVEGTPTAPTNLDYALSNGNQTINWTWNNGSNTDKINATLNETAIGNITSPYEYTNSTLPRWENLSIRGYNGTTNEFSGWTNETIYVLAPIAPTLHIGNAINIKDDWGRDFNSNLSANVTTANASNVWMNFTNAEFTNTSLGNLNLTLNEWVNESHNVNSPVTNISVDVYLNSTTSGAINDTDSFWYEVTKRTNTATMDSSATQNVDTSETFYVNATCNEEYSDTFLGAANLLEDGAIVATDSSVTDYVNFSHSEAVAGVYNYTVRFYNLTHYDNATTPTYSNVTVSEGEYPPGTPQNIQNVTGNFWVNHTWNTGSGNVTNSYNVSVNLTWHNGTTNLYYNNTPLSAHNWSNVSVWAYNTSGSGTLSASSISQNTQIPNNVPVLSGLPDNTTTEDVNQTDIFDLDDYYTDLDGDTATYLVESNNQSGDVSVTINASNNVSYTLANGWNGTAEVVINATDGWGGEDNDTFLIIVNAPPLPGDYMPGNPTTLGNTTGNYWVNYTWNVGGGNVTDSYNVSWNLTWYNTTTDEFMKKEVGASNWANITVFAYNSSGNGSLSAGSVSDNVQAPAFVPGDYTPPNPTTLANSTGNYWVNYTWVMGVPGNVTDSYNVSWNLTWYNTTLTPYMQKDVGASNWGNMTVYAYNSSGNGTLSDGSLSDNVQAPAYAPGDYPPATPTTLANTTGDGWVNYTWNSGGGANVTDSYNVSWNLTWYNTTLTAYMNDSVGEFGWANITVYAYNATGNGSLSAGSVSDDTQAGGGTFTTSMGITVYNLITYYGSATSTAEEFGTDIGGVDYIAKYNGSFYTHTMGFSANNFTTVHGIGYYVYLNASGSSTYSRNNISGTPYNTQLFNRWNTVGWTNATDTDAEGVAASIGSACKYTSLLNVDGVTYTTHTVGFTSNNHAVEKGEGYWVWVNTGVSWDRNS